MSPIAGNPQAVLASAAASWGPAFDSFVERDWAAIRERAPAHLVDVDWPMVARGVIAVAHELLRALCIRTLVLELNCARLLGQLAGDTPEARFAAFLTPLCDGGGWTSLFEEYPVLRDAVATVRHHLCAQVVELFERLAADRAALAAGGFPAGRLIGVSGSLSDPHRGGRGVWKLTFATAGGDAHVMYKPKPLAVDARFQRILEHCNAAIDRGDLPGVPRFLVMRVLDRGDYGWVEHFAPTPCAEPAAADRFYRRQGATLALLHVLLGTDVHYENLIAHGEYPIVVDLETLFHPFLVAPEAVPSARGAAEARLERSVLRVGLLPWRAFRSGDNAGVNIGALGDGEAQALPYLVPGWDGVGRDDMRMIDKQIALPIADNVPRIGDAVAPYFAHIDAIVGGCEAMARHLARERDAWTAPGGLLDGFADDPVRYVLRPTRTYAKVLQATAHPDHLRTQEAIAAVLSVLDQVNPELAGSPAIRAAENADLAVRDVPYFSGRPGSRDVWDSRGHRIADALPVACLAIARERLAAFDDAEVDRQIWYTRAALTAAAFQHLAPPAGAARDTAGSRGTTDERALDLAAGFGARLAAAAIEGRDDATWIGLVDVGTEAFTIAPLGPDLYDGVAGIAVFLATLGRATRDDRLMTLAERAARGVAAAVLGTGRIHIGGFVGVPSQLYALAQVDALAGGGSLARVLEPALDRLGPALAGAGDADIIYGAAGAILALLAVFQATRRDVVIPHLRACLGVLERTAVAQDTGVAWPGDHARPLLGFSHGNAGIACALSRLGEVLGGDPAAARCAALADAALRYERSRFDASRRNWPDFRAPEPSGRNMVAWCHGAPGVVLGRLAVLGDAGTAAELEVSIATALDGGRRGRHTLCHGEVGNLAIVAHAAHRLGRDDWRAGVAARLPALLDAVAGCPGVDSAFPDAAPGLMTGLAGLGYGLLALARPAGAPFVLALEPPSGA